MELYDLLQVSLYFLYAGDDVYTSQETKIWSSTTFHVDSFNSI
jgi:hypothetical protein